MIDVINVKNGWNKFYQDGVGTVNSYIGDNGKELGGYYKLSNGTFQAYSRYGTKAGNRKIFNSEDAAMKWITEGYRSCSMINVIREENASWKKWFDSELGRTYWSYKDEDDKELGYFYYADNDGDYYYSAHVGNRNKDFKSTDDAKNWVVRTVSNNKKRRKSESYVTEGYNLQKIRSFNDAKTLLDQIIDKRIVIRLYDNDDGNMLIDVESDPDYDSYCYVNYVDSANGYSSRKNKFKLDVAQELYDNRKHVNAFIRSEYD